MNNLRRVWMRVGDDGHWREITDPAQIAAAKEQHQAIDDDFNRRMARLDRAAPPVMCERFSPLTVGFLIGLAFGCVVGALA